MGEYYYKVINRIIGKIKQYFWKIVFRKNLKIGNKSVIYPGCHFMIEKNGKIEIGNECFFNRNCSFTSLGKISIGNNCIFGENVKIYDHNHKHVIGSKPFKKQGYEIDKVSIGDNVWVGSNVIILPGVEIGNNVVIAAGAIVTKSVEENKIYISNKKILEGTNGVTI